jgi:hypothetical protein
VGEAEAVVRGQRSGVWVRSSKEEKMLNIQIRPIQKWPGKENSDPKWSPFRKSYRDTLKDLEYELEKANAVDGSLVLEMYVDPREIRKDGQLRADARVQRHGVIFRFSRFTGRRFKRTDGSIRHETQDVSYPCDAFTHWQDNLRAIVLSMESLRRVERYGVFKYDEIISRLALPTADGKVSTRESAAAFMASYSGVAMKEILFSDTARSTAYRKAAQKLHPDAGGNPEEFVKLQEANKVLTATGAN